MMNLGQKLSAIITLKVDGYNIPSEVEMIIVVLYYDIERKREKCVEVVPRIKVIGIDEYINSIVECSFRKNEININ